MTNKKITEALQNKFDLTAYYGLVPETEEKIYHYFVLRMERLNKGTNPSLLTQSLTVSYVSENQVDLRETEIINTLEGIGLNFQEAVYGYLPKGKTGDCVDVVEFRFTRQIKNEC